MADLITLTRQPYRITSGMVGSGNLLPPLWTAVDVLQYDMLDLEFGVIGFETPGATPHVYIGIATGMQKESEDGWVVPGYSLLLFANAANQYYKGYLQFGALGGANTCFLRYVRWAVAGGGSWGTQAAATIWVRGMARTRNEIVTTAQGA